MWCTHAGGTFTQTHSRANSRSPNTPSIASPTPFSRSRSGPRLTNIFAGRIRMYWKNDKMPPGFSSFAYACRMSLHVCGREVVERQPGDDQVELPVLLNGPSCATDPSMRWQRLAASRNAGLSLNALRRCAANVGFSSTIHNSSSCAHPIDDAARDGAGARPCLENLLRAPRAADVAAERAAERAAARNDRAGRLVVTKELCEEGLVIG